MKKILLIGYLVGSCIQNACGAADSFLSIMDKEKEVVQFWIDICKNGDFTRASFESTRDAQEYKRISTLLQSLPKDRRRTLVNYQFTEQERKEINDTCHCFSDKEIDTTAYSVLHYAVDQENLAAIFFLIFHGASFERKARNKGIYEIAEHQNVKDYLMVLTQYFRLSESEPAGLDVTMPAWMIGTITNHIEAFCPRHYHEVIPNQLSWRYYMQVLQRLSVIDRKIIFNMRRYRGVHPTCQYNWGIVALLLCAGMPESKEHLNLLESDWPYSLKRLYFLLRVYEACFETVQTEKGFELCLKK